MVLHADFAGSQIARAVKPCERNCGWSCFTSQSGVFFFCQGDVLLITTWNQDVSIGWTDIRNSGRRLTPLKPSTL